MRDMGRRWLVPLLALGGLGCSEATSSHSSDASPGTVGPSADATVAASTSDGAVDARADATTDATAPVAPGWPGGRCVSGCSPACTPPYETCDVFPELGMSCFHEVTLSSGVSAAFCEPAADAAAPVLTTPPTYCALDVGPVDASDVADVGPVTSCLLGYGTCTPPGGPSRAKGANEAPGAPGWLCCALSASAVGVATDLQFICQPPDGGVLPLFFPPPLEPDGGDAGDGAAE